MFSSEMTLASAWIHLLVVDLFAARYTFVFLFCKFFVFMLFSVQDKVLTVTVIHSGRFFTMDRKTR